MPKLSQKLPYSHYLIDSMADLKETVKSDDLVLFLVDAPSAQAVKASKPITTENAKYLSTIMKAVNYKNIHSLFLTATPHMDDETYRSDKKRSEFIKDYRDTTHYIISKFNPKLIISMGSTAINVLHTRKTNITACRGIFTEVDIKGKNYKVFPMYSPQMGLVQPKNSNIIASDLHRVSRFIENDWTDIHKTNKDYNYEICTDLQNLIDKNPEMIAVDTETTGLHYKKDTDRPFLLQISYKPNHTYLIPLEKNYWVEEHRNHEKLLGQVKKILENPNIRKVGHNFKFDYHMLKKIGINVKGWTDDTMLMLRFVDENLTSKSLNDGVKLFVPSMAGFNDELEKTINKNDMINLEKDKMIQYAGNDTNATLQLFKVLDRILDKIPKHKRIYKEVYIPAMKVCADTIEDEGLLVDIDNLTETSKVYEQLVKDTHAEILEKLPERIKRSWVQQNKNLNLNSVPFKQFILFSEQGYNLTPKKFTKSTSFLKTEKDKLGSTDKEHLELLKEECPICADILEYTKLNKLSSTYIGKPKRGKNEAKGIFKNLINEKIYPSYLFHRTVTGRLSSENPNGQNLPKRGKGAKKFRESIIAEKGWKIVEVDFSQMEVRIMAWIANVQAMIDAYQKGYDLHELTAVKQLVKSKELAELNEAYKRGGIDEAIREFHLWDDGEGKLKDAYDMYRYRAKAPNFGLIYKMSLNGYFSYCRDVYQRKDMTMLLAEEEFEAFYEGFPELPSYFYRIIQFLYSHGYVENILGFRRNLPEIRSTNRGAQSEAERQGINFTDQSLGAWITLVGLIRVQKARLINSKFRDNAKMIGTIHDSILFQVKEDEIDYCLPIIDYLMSNPPFKELYGLESPVNFPVDFTIGDTFNTTDKWVKKDIKTVPDFVEPDLDFTSVLYN